MKTKPRNVIKPWGKEVWLELNDKYCFKKIHLNKGQRTSFQYHEIKLETSYILEGKIRVLLENNSGELTEIVMGPGESYTVCPYKKHRVTAIEDSVYLEVSTPEVDDIIRIADDTGRPDGRIEDEHKKV